MLIQLIRQLLHRMAPGRFRDPDIVIGDCLYCDEPVMDFAGRLDESGKIRHDHCQKLIRRNAVKSGLTSSLCGDAVRILCGVSGVPGVVSRSEVAINELPADGATPEDVLTFLIKAIRIIDDSPLSPTDRAILRSRFRSLKRQLLAELSS